MLAGMTEGFERIEFPKKGKKLRGTETVEVLQNRSGPFRAKEGVQETTYCKSLKKVRELPNADPAIRACRFVS